MSDAFNPRTVALLAKMELEGLYNAWEASKPLRVGYPHAISILVPDCDWCPRKHVLSVLYPELAVRPEPRPWDTWNNQINKHGWTIHEEIQGLLLKFGRGMRVVHTDGEPELDRSAFDEERMIWRSPDAIVDWGGHRYIIEVKGYRAETKGDKPNCSTLLWDRLDEAGPPPLAAHKQCNFYCHVTGIERGLIAVMNKNNQRWKVWAIQHDFDMAKPYTDRCYQVKGAVVLAQSSLARGEAVKLPARKCTSCKDRLAEKCPMRAVCFKEKD